MTILYNQVTVALTATQIVAASQTVPLFSEQISRRDVVVTNDGGHPVFLGDSAVTAANGYNLPDGSSVSIVLYNQDALYGIATGGTALISYIETGE